jgi:hypothetical protein
MEFEVSCQLHALAVLPPGKDPGTHWIGGWVDPRAGLDNVRRENFCPHRDSNSDASVVQPVASPYTERAIPAPTELIGTGSQC